VINRKEPELELEPEPQFVISVPAPEGRQFNFGSSAPAPQHCKKRIKKEDRIIRCMHKPIGRQTWRKIFPDNKLGLEYATHTLNFFFNNGKPKILFSGDNVRKH
jgi:hypothetical protein